MKPIVLEFVGGYWDGRSLRSDSPDQEEALLAAECYEISKHGRFGAGCADLSAVAVAFGRNHGWEDGRGCSAERGSSLIW